MTALRARLQGIRDVMEESARRVVSRLSRQHRRSGKGRRPGISAMMRIGGVEPWVRLSLLSVKDLVDEVVVVDSSQDAQVEADIQAATDAGVPTVHITEDADIYEASWTALRTARYRWFLQWDADFIAHTKGARSAARLRRRILSLGPGYFLVKWPMICLDVDLRHSLPLNNPHSEDWLLTYHPKVKYVRRGGVERRVVPLFFRHLRWTEVYGFHMRTVKPPVILLRRTYRSAWMQTSRDEPFEAYLRRRVEEDYQTDDLEEAGELYRNELRQQLVPYEGGYPDLLKSALRGDGSA